MVSKSAISFGLVHIPISLYTAAKDNDIHFNQLHKEDGSRVKYKKVCGLCGEELKTDDIVKGYEYEKGEYVTVSDAEIEKIKTEKEKSIQILHFANLDEISPVYYEKTYHALPQKGGEKAFELLRAAMAEEKKIAIAKSVFGARDTLIALIPREDGLLVETMLFEEDVKELPQSYKKTEPAKAELNMAKTLISSMESPFSPAEYKDEYREKLRALIADKIAGKAPGKPRTEPKKDNVIGLMDALKASVEAREKKLAPKKSKAASGAASKKESESKAGKKKKGA